MQTVKIILGFYFSYYFCDGGGGGGGSGCSGSGISNGGAWVGVVAVVAKKVFSHPAIGGVILRFGTLPEPWESENTSENLRRSASLIIVVVGIVVVAAAAAIAVIIVVVVKKRSFFLPYPGWCYSQTRDSVSL